MGLKVKNTYYSDKEMKQVLLRKNYVIKDLVVNGVDATFAYIEGTEPKYTVHEVFRQIVAKRMNQTKQEFLDSL